MPKSKVTLVWLMSPIHVAVLTSSIWSGPGASIDFNLLEETSRSRKLLWCLTYSHMFFARHVVMLWNCDILLLLMIMIFQHQIAGLMISQNLLVDKFLSLELFFLSITVPCEQRWELVMRWLLRYIMMQFRLLTARRSNEKNGWEDTNQSLQWNHEVLGQPVTTRYWWFGAGLR